MGGSEYPHPPEPNKLTGFMILQIQGGFALLTTERHGLSHFLREGCCFYVNQLDIVKR